MVVGLASSTAGLPALLRRILWAVSRASLAFKGAACVVGTVVLVSAAACDSGEDAVDAPGSVAFVTENGPGSRILVVNTDGSDRRLLIPPRAPYDHVQAIAWSPDGQSIAYTGGFQGWNNDKAYDDLYVVDARGARSRRLTASPEDDWDPAWSPDGTRIAFDRQDDGYNWIYVANADGSGVRRLTANFNWHPDWTPDGRISFIGDGGIWLINANGSGKRLIAQAPIEITGREASVMAWSPDGARVAFSTGSALWVMRSDGTARTKLYGDPDRQTGYPVWSPDGRQIAFTQGDGDLEIFVVNADGTGLRNVTDNERVQDEEPSWSPDGRALAFTSIRDGRSDIYVMTVAGEGRRNVSGTPGNDRSPSWSPSPT